MLRVAQRCGRIRRTISVFLTAALSLGMVLSGLGVDAQGTRALAADPPPKRTLSDPNPNFSGVWVDTTNNEIFVADDNRHNVIVYSRTATGAAAPLRSIGGLATGIDYPSSVALDLTNNEIWAVDDDTADRAVVFSRTAAGNVAPLRTIDFKFFFGSDGLTPSDVRRTWGWAVDAANNEVAGTFQNGNAIHVFDRSVGDTLLRSITGSSTGLADPHGIHIDTLNNEFVVVNEGHTGSSLVAPSITVYARTATGNVAPLRTIQGALTGLSQPKQVSVDTTNNEIAVANGSGSITVYSRTANGNVAPLRTISGALTGLGSPAGVFIDTTNNEIVVGNWGNHTLTVYARTATGNVAPLRTITSGTSSAVGFGNPGAAAVDTTNGEYYVTNCVSHPRVAVFGRLASGQTAPVRTIEGQNTHISRSLHGIAFDGMNNEVLLPSTLENAILVFNRLDSGDVAPKRMIQGASTLISKPQGIAVDAVNNEIALANEGQSVGPPIIAASVTIYGRLATGNVAPLRQITNVDMAKPVGVWIDNVNNEIWVSDEKATAGPTLWVFSRTANGASAPLRTITGLNTMLDKTRQIIVDPTNNEVYVATQGDRSVNPPVLGAVLVFNRLDSGNVAPKRFLRHVANSFVQHPRSILLDLGNNELGVGDSKLNELRVFDRLFGVAPTPPPAPTGLTATAGNARVDLSWTASAGATSYNVKRATVTGGPYTTIATGVTVTTYADTTVVNGTTYFYVVSAVNANGESANSNQASATPSAAPPAPTGLTATAGPRGSLRIDLSWTASTGATSYNVKRATVTGGPYTTIATGVTATTYSNTGLTKGVTYFYVVSAVNANGESPNSNQASATAR